MKTINKLPRHKIKQYTHASIHTFNSLCLSCSSFLFICSQALESEWTRPLLSSVVQKEEYKIDAPSFTRLESHSGAKHWWWNRLLASHRTSSLNRMPFVVHISNKQGQPKDVLHSGILQQQEGKKKYWHCLQSHQTHSVVTQIKKYWRFSRTRKSELKCGKLHYVDSWV